jgi:hypothetical protein
MFVIIQMDGGKNCRNHTQLPRRVYLSKSRRDCLSACSDVRETTPLAISLTSAWDTPSSSRALVIVAIKTCSECAPEEKRAFRILASSRSGVITVALDAWGNSSRFFHSSNSALTDFLIPRLPQVVVVVVAQKRTSDSMQSKPKSRKLKKEAGSSFH